ncbi:hypothetical protein HK100_000600 [Physocladia obscura]|uniref:Nitroreductase domain-containing protein n=1 Tax=Physocladia obscura TaxID=109957 RepID=A0AAD5T9G0_9FUNG|nr:hypothetical protein HK100_000600 [Physocladia obscura]
MSESYTSIDTSTALSALFLSHRSIRSYTKDPVPQELLEAAIGEAIAGGSSSGNLNSYSFIITRDAAKKAALFPLHSEQDMVTECAVVITICADWFRTREWLSQRGAKDNFDNFFGYHVGVVDAIIVAQNLVLGLEARGLGICYLGTTLSSMTEISDVLELPETCIPITTLTVGYPAENPPKRDRLPTAAYIHNETYRLPDPTEISEIYSKREVNGWNRYMAMPRLKDAIEEAGIKNLAEFYTSDKKYPESALLQDGTNVLNSLAKKRFVDIAGGYIGSESIAKHSKKITKTTTKTTTNPSGKKTTTTIVSTSFT